MRSGNSETSLGQSSKILAVHENDRISARHHLAPVPEYLSAWPGKFVKCPGHPAEAFMSPSFVLNGKPITLDADPNMPLLWAIRELAGLPGTKFGCGMAQCGACTVHLQGKAIRSCVTTLSAVAGKNITTIEGLQSRPAKAVQAAWVQLQVPQ